MTIYGLSQTSGEERLLEVQRVEKGILLHIHGGSDDGTDRGKIVVPIDNVVERLSEPPAGPMSINGSSPLYGTPKRLELEIRRNEVLLCVRSGPEGGRDIAVGLDDFQDAVEAAA